jgi:Spy/CpxP family protein refolding chaperone
MKLFKLLVLSVVALMAAPALAQNKPADADMQMLIDKVKADKKLVVAANLSLTEAEAKAFWPIYDAYQKELQTINEKLARTILAYADGYNNNSLTDDQARRLSNEALSIDQDELTLRKSYAAKLDKVIPAKKAARYIQIENKIRAAIRYEMAAGIPLVR